MAHLLEERFWGHLVELKMSLKTELVKWWMLESIVKREVVVWENRRSAVLGIGFYIVDR